MNKRLGVVLILGILVLSMSFSSASWFSDVFGRITGNVVETYCTSFTLTDWSACVGGSQTRSVIARFPAGCTYDKQNLPVVYQPCSSSVTCTSFTYTPWSACVNGQQTRTIATQSPSGCTGGSPVLTQPCSIPTCTSFTYTDWSSCIKNQQTRTIASQFPVGCSGGSPENLSKSCDDFNYVIDNTSANNQTITNLSIPLAEESFDTNSVNLSVEEFAEGELEGDFVDESFVEELDEFVEDEDYAEGYIIQFEKAPVVERRVELEAIAVENEDNFFANIPIIENFYVTHENIDSKAESYERELDSDREQIKREMSQRGFSITGNVVSNINSENGIIVGFFNWLQNFKWTGMAVSDESFNESMREYTQVFNGMYLNISKDEAEAIEKIDGVKSVSRNMKVYSDLMTSVPLMQGGILAGKLDEDGNDCTISLKPCLTGEGITIAIIDTGVDYTHPDLGGCLGPACKVIGGYDFVNSDNDPIDDMGHGTHCAGIAAGNGNGGLKGVAPSAKILAYKVLDSSGSGSFDNVIAAFERAIIDGADVISLSLGGGGDPDSAQSLAADNAVLAGAVVVASAGNSGPSKMTIGSPGNANKVIGVGATDKLNDLAYFSSRGPVIWINEDRKLVGSIKPDIVASGVNICSAQSSNNPWNFYLCLGDNHVAISGTSMAAPHVSGAAALVLQRNSNLTPQEVAEVLTAGTTDLGLDPIEQGKGLLNLSKSFSFNLKPISVKINSVKEIRSNEEIKIFGSVVGEGIVKYEVYAKQTFRSSGWDLICSGTTGKENSSLCNNYINSSLYGGVRTTKLVAYNTEGAISQDYYLSIFDRGNLNITNCLELQKMELSPFSNHVLMNNIDCSDSVNWNCNQNNQNCKGFLPIPIFLGNFNGNNFTISNLYINSPDSNNVGLFSQITTLYYGVLKGEIKNINFENANVVGREYVGGLAGYFSGAVYKLSNIHFTRSNVLGSSSRVGGIVGQFGKYGDGSMVSIDSSHFEGNVSSSNGSLVGGLLGYTGCGLRVCISNSYSAGNVFGTGEYVGGLTGYLESYDLLDSYSSANVTGNDSVGGLVGFFKSRQMLNSYSTGNVFGNDYVGGLIGRGNGGSIYNSYSTGEVLGNNYVGGLMGMGGITGGSVYNSHSAGNVLGKGYLGGLVGKDANVYNSHSTGNVLGKGYLGGLIGYGGNSAGSISNSYFIGDILGETNDCEEESDGKVAVSCDNVGGLVGEIRGGNISNSYSMSNISSGGDNVGGLVGSIGGFGGDVVNSYSMSNISSGGDNVGGLVGIGGSIYNSYSTGSVSGSGNVGGLVGAGKSISNSYSIGNVFGNIVLCEESGDTGRVSSEPISGSGILGETGGVTCTPKGIGGLIGYINGGTISNSYSIGNVFGNNNTGGLIGYYRSGTVTNSFWGVQTSGKTNMCGYTQWASNSACNNSRGKTTTEMKTKSTFADSGWNFNNIWNSLLNINSGYPYLSVILDSSSNSDHGFPTFSNLKNSGNVYNGGVVNLSVTIANTNGSVFLMTLGSNVNIPATHIGNNVYSASKMLVPADAMGVEVMPYAFRFHAYGSGASHNLGISPETIVYIVIGKSIYLNTQFKSRWAINTFNDVVFYMANEAGRNQNLRYTLSYSKCAYVNRAGCQYTLFHEKNKVFVSEEEFQEATSLKLSELGEYVLKVDVSGDETIQEYYSFEVVEFVDPEEDYTPVQSTEPVDEPVYITNPGDAGNTGGGGGGGGGSGNTNTANTFVNCTSGWICTFGSCVDGKKAESCIDINACGNLSGKPQERTLDCGETLPSNNAEFNNEEDDKSWSWVIWLIGFLILCVLIFIIFLLYRRGFFKKADNDVKIKKVNDLLEEANTAFDKGEISGAIDYYTQAKKYFYDNHLVSSEVYQKFLKVYNKIEKRE